MSASVARSSGSMFSRKVSANCAGSWGTIAEGPLVDPTSETGNLHIASRRLYTSRVLMSWPSISMLPSVPSMSAIRNKEAKVELFPELLYVRLYLSDIRETDPVRPQIPTFIPLVMLKVRSFKINGPSKEYRKLTCRKLIWPLVTHKDVVPSCLDVASLLEVSGGRSATHRIR